MSNYTRNLEFLCRKHKIDQSTLADEIGIDFTDLRKPSPDDLWRISRHFGISIDVLVSGQFEKIAAIKEKDIRLLVMDVDGVMTDGGMYYSESGDEYKKFNVKDGMAIKKLPEKGISTAIISNGSNKSLIARRAVHLGIERVEVGTQLKLDVLKAWCAQLGIELSQVAYIGDDINDEPVMKAVGLSACPADAVDSVKRISQILLERKGGEGCVREFIDLYLLK